MLFYMFYRSFFYVVFFFFNDPATTEIYTLSLHDALPIYDVGIGEHDRPHELGEAPIRPGGGPLGASPDRKSTRLNSSHRCISYAVFCLKKKKKKQKKKTQININI